MSRTRAIGILQPKSKVLPQDHSSFGEMYSDRISSGPASNRKRSVKDRLGGNVDSVDHSSRQDFNKRYRGYDQKWHHDLFNEVDNSSIAKSEQMSTQDLRSKLKRSALREGRGGNDTSGGPKDLREKLSGPIPSHQSNIQTVSTPQQRSSSTMKVATQGVTTLSGSKPTADKPKSSGVQKGVQKVSNGAEVMTILTFLQSLGLSKYLITFQAEEIDMPVLRMMKDEELKELGIPMGPRKKIMLSLVSQSKQ